jgi:hypothetical protein
MEGNYSNIGRLAHKRRCINAQDQAQGTREPLYIVPAYDMNTAVVGSCVSLFSLY